MQLISQIPPWAYLASGAIVGWLRNFWTQLYNRTIGHVIRRIMVSVTVEEVDHVEAWLWLQFWAEKRLRDRRISTLLLRRNGRAAAVCDDELQGQPGPQACEYELIPSYGTYPFRWRKRYLLVFNSGKEETPTNSSGLKASSFLPARRRVGISIWGTRNRNLLLEILSEAKAEWEAEHPEALRYFFHRYSYWNSRPMAARSRNTVYFSEGLIDDVLSDMHQFLKNKEKYELMGIPWRRGYLFYGPPGSGKTTLVQTIATELRLSLYYLSLAALRSRDDLASLLDEVKPGSIVLIEDVDCIAAAAERMNSGENGDKATASPSRRDSDITPSDLLNYIDGIIASQGRILIMTTNYPEKLDRALVRAGRVDRKWEITFARHEQLLHFHKMARLSKMTDMDEEQFIASLPDLATIADAQALLFSGTRQEIEIDDIACLGRR